MEAAWNARAHLVRDAVLVKVKLPARLTYEDGLRHKCNTDAQCALCLGHDGLACFVRRGELSGRDLKKALQQR